MNQIRLIELSWINLANQEPSLDEDFKYEIICHVLSVTRLGKI